MSISPDEIPKKIGRYHIVERLNKQKMGAVYKAQDPLLERTVTLKTFLAETSPDNQDIAHLRLRFLHPDGVPVTLNHPNILNVLDRGESEGILYLATEYVEGETLADILATGERIQPDKALRILGQTARAVDYAHRKGIIHRDINPSNILVYEGDKAKLTDLGTVWMLDAAPALRDLPLPSYRSPEQVLGNRIDVKTDIFSFGVVAFELLSGELPFPGDNVTATMYKILHSQPARPSRLAALGMDATRWDKVFSKVLAKSPPNRFDTAGDFVSELVSCLVSVSREQDNAGCVLYEVADPPEVGKQILDEDVQFTSYRPKAMRPEHRYQMLVFAHRAALAPGQPGQSTKVEEIAEVLLGPKLPLYPFVTQDSKLSVPREEDLTLLPSIEGIEFEPPSRTFTWTGDLHYEQFILRASGSLEGRVARGRLCIYLGLILIAEINMAIPVSRTAEPVADSSQSKRDDARRYRKVFPSYSHRDTPIVQHVECVARLLGDRYLRDVTTLRAGQDWRKSIAEMIRDADVFQLFWSRNSMRSEEVQREWRYALALGREEFVRPCYWEIPLPRQPELDLPPRALERLHFQILPGATTKESGVDTDATWMPSVPPLATPPPPSPTTGAFPRDPKPRVSMSSGAYRKRFSWFKAMTLVFGVFFIGTISFMFWVNVGGPDPAQPPLPQVGDLVEPGPDVVEPVCIECPDVPYPEAARKPNLQGLVEVSFIVNELGKVEDIRIVESVGEAFDVAVIENLREWEFEPPRKLGVRVKLRLHRRFKFEVPPSR